MKRRLTPAMVAAALAGLAASQPASAIIIGYGPSNSGGFSAFELITTARNLPAAHADALSRTFPGDPIRGIPANPGVSGHLASIHSTAENQAAFIDGAWIGLHDNESFGASEGSFAWTTGEPVSFTNWGGGEPNNFANAAEPLLGEDAVHFGGGGAWNDNSGFPGFDRNTVESRQYIVEYPLQLAADPVDPVNALLVPDASGKVHAYQLVTAGTQWNEARIAAEGMTFEGAQGHLVTITSAAEQAVVQGIGGGDRWIGLTDNEGFGGTEAGNNPNGGWAWVNGETFSFQNFATGEPNDSGGEDAAHLRGDGLWNDNKSNIPGSDLGGPALAYIVEFETGIMMPNVPNPGFNVRQVNSSTGGFGGGAAALDNAQALLASPGANTQFTANLPVIDLLDPQSGAGAHFATNTPFLGDTTADDNDFAVEATGFVFFPVPGQYTFIVNSDDGFELQIEGAELQAVVGGANDVATGPDSFASPVPRGSTDTLGIFLIDDAGFYPINLSYYENGGGANVELSAAFGAYPAFSPGLFRLVGDVANGGLLVSQTPVALVPEPTTVMLGLMGFAGLAFRRRRHA